jgi:putative N6-adenine-specific DNA methylase
VEFEGRLEDCFKANLHLRLPNRILMRINTFKATNFRQLEKKTGDMAWELYLHPQTRMKVHVATRHCRLHHTNAIAERIKRAISERLVDFKFEQVIPATTGGHQHFYVRGVDDVFSLSIDSSGELLYKRGLKAHSGKAPLRETLAAGALMLAGYDGREPLLDPLCGSGTFSLEAALMAKRIPAGWFRDFAFTRWPSFIEKRWNYIKRQAESGIMQFQKPMIYASDTDRDACQKFERCIENYHLTDAVKVCQIDFFELNPRELTDRIGTICINPPYGRRLGAKQDSERFFNAMGEKLRQAYKGWKLVLIAPHRKAITSLPFQKHSIPIWHGGLKLRLLIGKIQ